MAAIGFASVVSRQELVIHVCGGPTRHSQDVLAETEILVEKVAQDRGIKYVLVGNPDDLVFHMDVTKSLWVTGAWASTPQELQDIGLPRWTEMQLPLVPLLCYAGEAFTVTWPQTIVEIHS